MKKLLSPIATILSATALAFAASAYAGEDEQAGDKSVVLQQPQPPECNIDASVGYDSTYIFRGDNLTPHSDGIQTTDVSMTEHGFTLGIWNGLQLGNAHYAYSYSTPILYSNGVFVPTSITKTVTHTDYDETQAYFQYAQPIGSVTLAAGAIGYFSSSSGNTFYQGTPSLSGYRYIDSTRAVDSHDNVLRPFIAISASTIPYVTPSLTWYDTALESPDEGRDNTSYFEAKVLGKIEVNKWVSIHPYSLVGYSAGDRVSGVENGLDEIYYNGFQVIQVGTDVTFTIRPYWDISPSVNYDHLLHAPPALSQRDNVWGGVKMAFHF